MINVREALILCGGKGTRLQSVVRDRPKPMADVSGRPFLSWIIDNLVSHGIQQVILLTGYKSVFIEEWVKIWQDKVSISISKEKEPLGTGGAVKQALPLITADDFFVFNGDSYAPFDLTVMAEQHLLRKADATILLCQKTDAKRYGSVKVDKDQKIVKFEEKNEESDSGFISAGVYILKKSMFEDIQAKTFSLEDDVFSKITSKKFYGVNSRAPFIDIGTPESYRNASEFIDLYR
jgi:NDP-sugar pyrophosphorylase family protein